MTKLQIIHFILWGVSPPRDFTVHRHSLNIMQNIEICFFKMCNYDIEKVITNCSIFYLCTNYL